MDAFVDFHYVTLGGNKYFINEICLIIFSKETREPVYNNHSTFKFPNLTLDHKSNITYKYTKTNCHGLDYKIGALHWTEIREFISPLLKCDSIYLRGSLKRKIIIDKMNDMFSGHPPVYNITTKIARVLADKGVKGEGENLPGYLTYDEIKSKYDFNKLYCTLHGMNENTQNKCIVGQCVATFKWFIDNYYCLM